MPLYLVTSGGILFNCWDKRHINVTLKPIQLQRRDEIYSNVNATKVEKMNWMAYAEIKAFELKYSNVLSAKKMGNQQRSPE